MTNLELSPIDRVYAHIPVTATLAAGSPATLTGVDVAVLPPRTDPNGQTTWTASTYSAGTATVLLAGPAADPTGALVVPTGGGAVWIRITDIPEVQAVNVGFISIA